MNIFLGPWCQGQGQMEVKGQMYIHRDISMSIWDRANIMKLAYILGLGLAVIRFSRPRGQGHGHTEVKGQIYVHCDISLYILDRA